MKLSKELITVKNANGEDIRLVNLGSLAFFSNFISITSSRKHLEDISHDQIASLKHKLISKNEDYVYLSIGSDRNRKRRRNELTNIKKIEGKNHVRIMLKDIFGFAEHQFGFG